MTCLLSETLLAKEALYITVIVCRKQLSHSGFPLVGDPHHLSKIWLVLPKNWHVPYHFGQKTLFCYAVFDYGQNVPPTNKVFPTVRDGRRSPTSQSYAHPPTWKNSPCRLHHSVHPLSARGLNLLPSFQKGGLERISTIKGGCWERAG